MNCEHRGFKPHFPRSETVCPRPSYPQQHDNSGKPGCFPQNLALRFVRYLSVRTLARTHAESTHRLRVRGSSRLNKRHAPRRCAWRGLGIPPLVREDALDQRGFFDRSDDLQSAAALRAAFDIDVEHALDQARPAQTR